VFARLEIYLPKRPFFVVKRVVTLLRAARIGARPQAGQGLVEQMSTEWQECFAIITVILGNVSSAAQQVLLPELVN
jgi:hypothetical protein